MEPGSFFWTPTENPVTAAAATTSPRGTSIVKSAKYVLGPDTSPAIHPKPIQSIIASSSHAPSRSAPLGAACGYSHLGLGRRKRERGAFGRETHLDMRSVAERLILGLSASTERDGRAAREIVAVASLIDQR